MAYKPLKLKDSKPDPNADQNSLTKSLRDGTLDPELGKTLAEAAIAAAREPKRGAFGGPAIETGVPFRVQRPLIADYKPDAPISVTINVTIINGGKK